MTVERITADRALLNIRVVGTQCRKTPNALRKMLGSIRLKTETKSSYAISNACTGSVLTGTILCCLYKCLSVQFARFRLEQKKQFALMSIIATNPERFAVCFVVAATWQSECFVTIQI